MYIMFKNKPAFSLVELLTTVGITGVLAVVGIKSYQKQTNQAKQAEAKKSLSYIYSAQRSFYNNWGAYHENLIAAGAVPTGVYNYDAGFGKDAVLARIDGYPNNDVLNVKACTNFYQICKGECLTDLESKAPNEYKRSYNSDCQVNSAQLLKAGSSATNSAGASASDFKAVATTRLKTVDVWSIDKKGALKNDDDGTE